jgi:hypothetical protein
MRWLEKANFLKATVAVVIVLAWFTATNHCLLALQQSQGTPVVTSHCPGHSEESKGTDHGPSGMLNCCQGLKSPNIDVAKAKISFSPVLVGIHFFAIGYPVFSKTSKGIRPTSEYDTGPPSAGSFVEVVLQRSLRENAPPLRS